MGNDVVAPVPVVDHVSDTDKADIGVGREHLHTALPPHDTYEGRHRYDPLVEWTAAEERAVVRKTDLRLLSWLCVMVRAAVVYSSHKLIVCSSLACNLTVET
jgi:hypothetical protein